MKVFAHICATLFDLVMWPFSGMAPIVAMLVISALTGVLMLIVYKVTSNQPQIKEVKQKIKAHFLAIALYKESLAVLTSSARKIVWHNLRYVQLNLKPLLFMIVPVGLLLINIDAWYGFRSLPVGTPFVLNAQVEPSVDLLTADLRLEVPAGLKVETPVVRVVAENEISWRVAAQKPGSYDVGVVINGERQDKRVVVDQPLTRLSSLRYKSGFWNELLYPTEALLPDAAAVSEIAITYPATELSVFGWQMHWIYAYFILSILFALPLRGVFRVEV